MIHYGYRLKGGGQSMKQLTKRQLIVLLNSLAVQQDVSHAQVPERPKASEFSKFAEANALAQAEIMKGSNVISFGELDELFTQLVDECYREMEKIEDGTDLASLPRTGQYLH
jgi:hypothetical protein